jgi:enoyl-CoA hydratase/carnithine racemase
MSRFEPLPALVLQADAEGVRTLTLNNPAARNALSGAMMARLREAFTAASADPAVRVVVLAAGGPAFCAGHDLKEMRANPDSAFHAALMDECVALMLAIVRCPKPVIAQVHAIATAAGCQLVASCDLAVAAEGARFATPGVNIGLFCSTPMVALSRNLTRKHAMEMLLSGEMIDAPTAWRMGLVNRVVPAAELESTVLAMARGIAAKSSHTLAVGKEAFYRQAEMPLEEAYRYAAGVMVQNLQAEDAREGIDAFIGKRAPCWVDR